MHPLPAPNNSQSPRGGEARDHTPPRMNTPATNHPPSSATAGRASVSTLSTLTPADGKKKRKHRGGKKRRNRRQSFAAPSEASGLQSLDEDLPEDPLLEAPENSSQTLRPPFYKANTGNISGESLNSDALLDHREQPTMRPRGDSRPTASFLATSYRNSPFPALETAARRRHHSQQDGSSSNSSEHDDFNDRTPLISGSRQRKSPIQSGYGLFRVKSNTSTLSTGSKQQRKRAIATGQSLPKSEPEYDINNPPSVPPSPAFGAQLDDVMVDDVNFLDRPLDARRSVPASNHDALIDIDGDGAGQPNSAPPSPRLRPDGMQRHRPMTSAEEDVCFPSDAVSEVGEYYNQSQPQGPFAPSGRRRRREREWPQLWVLDEWSRVEKEERAAGERRAKKISEPVFVEGRLRPSNTAWHRAQEDAQYRYTYFNEEFESTIHAQTISELVQPGGTFRELFIPDPPELSDSSSSEEEDLVNVEQTVDDVSGPQSPKSQPANTGNTNLADRIKSRLEPNGKNSEQSSGSATPRKQGSTSRPGKPKKYGPRPTFWLDVLCPTDQEMRVLSKTFGIHALTSEDIMMQEAREKVELFRNYYFINYRTFEQDTNSEDYLEPINMYVCVFRYGILTFHFSPIPHPANVRRRIRQLSDYLILSADWISYAIIDDITDVYQPLITSIEQEVDQIEDLILRSFHNSIELAGHHDEKGSDNGTDASDTEISGIDMLLRIGECRKKVMSLYRLLGTKADVIKGFAKRCNEQWEVAPRSEIGLYLGDIQDHILTMTGNLSHYETLLARAHGNYLAQVSIHMNERQEETADVLGKLSVLGTVCLPLTLITGLFGANFKVPGQDVDNLHWFWATTAGLIFFGIACFYWCKKVYKII
ncbi:hypothetical protein A1O1_08279 [Capronia coronata CBS 617.96]|uniref:Magnesium transporter n=1 Tax=Capronia coronata CBS 617.96 TaxID=1182541 RepID=W9XHY7_9EURO|nr:uncharacterized protein A1O1_08279 [Capronia coronata CBS 617.96]EXJ80137.1 hypothetical protein A1O1_08279 [Capronia coronata CBS 617.96]